MIVVSARKERDCARATAELRAHGHLGVAIQAAVVLVVVCGILVAVACATCNVAAVGSTLCAVARLWSLSSAALGHVDCDTSLEVLIFL